jgi:hypothetical protein
MQIVKVMGGLGNQMFAYAFALALRKRGRDARLDVTWHDRNRAHNGWELARIFPLDIPLCTVEERDRLGDLSPSFGSRLRRKLLGERRGHFKERRPGYDERFLGIEGDAYLDGFWQSPRYHEGVETEIEAAFAFPAGLEPEARACLEAAKGRRAVGVHVRRGDFLSSEALYGVCSESYYRLAVETALEGARDPLILFFSDDLDWCRDRLAPGRDAVYVDWNTGPESWRDMRLMTMCERLVIANSSFSWWGARLGRSGRAERMIIAPSRWFGGELEDNPDIALPGWIRIDSRG